MHFRSLASHSLPLLIVLGVCSCLAAGGEREKWIIGTWTTHIEGRPNRTVVFHADHSWGVQGYGAPGPDGELTIHEDIRGRRWDIHGDRLVLRAPSDDGFQSFGEKIVSFTRDKIVTDITT